jgi:histidinol-phosphate/aromatic aminotransferase/cobyric acid decarboxylase-like protein
MRDQEYMDQTWGCTVAWRKRTVDWLKEVQPSWEVHGEPFLSWLWIDTKDAVKASQAVARAKAAGVPIRNGAMGYELPTFIRVAVRSPNAQEVLKKALTF